ncbi:MAG: hypothetical protein EOO92_13705, partial [Pedobacter sp.]
MTRLLLSLLLSTVAVFSYAQSISKSRTSSYYTYIYKLTDKEAYMAVENPANDSFLHTLVDSFYTDKGYMKLLLPGNYIYASAASGEMKYHFKPVNNVLISTVNITGSLQVTISNLSGEPVGNATVLLQHKRRFSYDAKSMLYSIPSRPEEGVISVNYLGVTNFFWYENNDYIPKKLDKKQTADFDGGNYGYFLFNKPKFKPNDTVRYKAFLLNKNGKIKVNRRLRLEVGTKITDTIIPYRPGAYEGIFVLSDSLGLKLDEWQKVTLSEESNGVWKVVMERQIHYSDYNLKSIRLDVNSDRTLHRPGMPITLLIKAVDDNQLTVPDARVEMTFLHSDPRFNKVNTFIKDTLWTKTLYLDPIGETKLVLPDSIFADARFNFVGHFRLLNSDNESIRIEKDFKFNNLKEEVIVALKDGKLNFDYLLDGKSLPKSATLYSSSDEFDLTDTVQISMPVALKVNPYFTDYKVVVSNDLAVNVDASSLTNPKPLIVVMATADSLKFSIDNKTLPFWYTVFAGDQPVLTRYSTGVDTAIAFNTNKTARISVSHMFGGKEFNTYSGTSFDDKQINIELNAPRLVYPGQEVDVELKVTDFYNKPMENTDVTAFAYTSKFGVRGAMRLYTFKTDSKNVQPRYDSYAESSDKSGSGKIDWNRWAKPLGLDTIAYFKFTQTKDLFITTETVADTMAIIAPFVLVDGKISPAYAIFVDDLPVFYDQSVQLMRYAFRILPGKHQIRLRVSGYNVEYSGEFLAGKKVILGIAADPANTKAKVSLANKVLSLDELDELSHNLVYITDNFAPEKTTVSTENGEHLLLNRQDQNYQNSNLAIVGPISANYLMFSSG